MKAICPSCGIEFELSVNQQHRKKQLIGYKPTCRKQECRIAMIRKGVFNRRPAW